MAPCWADGAAVAATRALLDGGRWHFQHGPMDVVLQAEGEPQAVAAAHAEAWARFVPLLDELVAELPLLKQPIAAGAVPAGPVARRMWDACAVHAPLFMTPMAAVAGAVAQELIAAYRRAGIVRAWANNGGDIAFHLAPGTSARVGLYADLARFDPADAAALRTDGQFDVHAAQPVRGVATSGWRGRSFSLGIADSVTVLAATAAGADAAATVIANAVDVSHPDIRRLPASECKDGSDLGDTPVTVEVPTLPPQVVAQALDAGARRARAVQAAGHAFAAILVCQGQWRLVQPLSSASGEAGQPALGSVFA